MTAKKKRILIFTDLDGTLLDADDYSFKEALPALKKIKERKISLILCSSKTRAELELCQRNLGIKGPFISENGGAIFIPPGYFRQIPVELKKRGKYLVLELGTPYHKIRRKFLKVFDELNLKAVGFGDLKAEEISFLLNLSRAGAELAKKREYDEPFYFLKKIRKEKIKLAEKEFNKSGLGLTTGGKLYHLTGGNDKGKAVKLLSRIYKNNWENDILAIGLGDSLNDLSMLESVDIPVLIRKKDNSYEKEILNKLSPGVNRTVHTTGSRGRVYKAQGIGPRGWNQAILDLIERHGSKAG
jgi:mannosyl-3-phosphoglycerate phosphatase